MESLQSVELLIKASEHYHLYLCGGGVPLQGHPQNYGSLEKVANKVKKGKFEIKTQEKTIKLRLLTCSAEYPFKRLGRVGRTIQLYRCEASLRGTQCVCRRLYEDAVPQLRAEALVRNHTQGVKLDIPIFDEIRVAARGSLAIAVVSKGPKGVEDRYTALSATVSRATGYLEGLGLSLGSGVVQPQVSHM